MLNLFQHPLLLLLYSLRPALPFQLPKQVRDDKKGALFLVMLHPNCHAEFISASVMHIHLTFPKNQVLNIIIGVKSMHFHLLQSVFACLIIFLR